MSFEACFVAGDFEIACLEIDHEMLCNPQFSFSMILCSIFWDNNEGMCVRGL